jgi:hypothetical protein
MEAKKQEEDGSQVADILGTLAELDRGNFCVDAGRKMQRLCEAVANVRGSGILTIKLKIKPAGFSKDTGRVNQFEIQPEIKIDEPEHPLRKSLFFVTEDAKLTRDDPDQEKLFAEDAREDVQKHG